MSVFKSSNASPNLEEVDLNNDNTFSCMINTSGEPIQAYKMQILSAKGDETIYDSGITPVNVKNKDILNIEHINSDTHDVDKTFNNGKDYQWGVRVYNQPAGATTQPNTLICEGYIVGSTKYVIWSDIPKEETDAIGQIVYDRYIEFKTDAEEMLLGAKDDKSLQLPDTSESKFIERKKIDWVTKELGKDKNIIKIETAEDFTYNYKDGVAYQIYQCSSNHTVNSMFADPNSNVNVSNFIVVYKDYKDAVKAHDAHETPATSNPTVTPVFNSRKVTGYSSDTGEIRVHDAFPTVPVNGMVYLLYSYDSVNDVYTEVEPSPINFTVPMDTHYYNKGPLSLILDVGTKYYRDKELTDLAGTVATTQTGKPVTFVNATASSVTENTRPIKVDIGTTYYTDTTLTKIGGTLKTESEYKYINNTYCSIVVETRSTTLPVGTKYYRDRSLKEYIGATKSVISQYTKINNNYSSIVLEGEVYYVATPSIKSTTCYIATPTAKETTCYIATPDDFLAGATEEELPVTFIDSDHGQITIKIEGVDTEYYVDFKDMRSQYGATLENVYQTQTVGGMPINSNFYKVLSNNNEDKRLFIQPNINIKTDETNPNEIVFDDGTRIDIIKQTEINETTGEIIDITFDKLDNTQWLLQGDSISVVDEEEIPIQPQLDYKVYSDFMDMMPYNLFYARQTPDIHIQVRNYNTNSTYRAKSGSNIYRYIIKDSDPVEERKYYYDTECTQEAGELTYTASCLFVNKNYSTIDMEGTIYYVPSIALGIIPIDIPLDRVSDNYGFINYSIEEGASIEQYYVDIVDIESADYVDVVPYRYEYTVEDIPHSRILSFYSYKDIEFNVALENASQSIKYYQYILYDEDGVEIDKSDEIYSTEVKWYYRGFDSSDDIANPQKYTIKIIIVDEYNKKFEKEISFGVYYASELGIIPLDINLICHEKAAQINVATPLNVESTDYEDFESVDNFDILSNGSKYYVNIKENETLNYTNVVNEEQTPIIISPNFSFLTQFRITNEFSNHTGIQEERPVFQIAHKIEGEEEEYDIEEYKLTLSSITKYYCYYNEEEDRMMFTTNGNVLRFHLYRIGEEEPLNCFNVNGTKINYWDINENSNGAFALPTSLKYMLQATDNFIIYNNPEEGLPETGEAGKRYVLTHDWLNYNAGIYYYDTRAGWIPDSESLYIFIEDINQLDNITRGDFINPPDGCLIDGKFQWRESDLSWIDSQEYFDNFNAKIFNSKWFILYLTVNKNTNEVNCNIDIRGGIL